MKINIDKFKEYLRNEIVILKRSVEKSAKDCNFGQSAEEYGTMLANLYLLTCIDDMGSEEQQGAIEEGWLEVDE